MRLSELKKPVYMALTCILSSIVFQMLFLNQAESKLFLIYDMASLSLESDTIVECLESDYDVQQRLNDNGFKYTRHVGACEVLRVFKGKVKEEQTITIEMPPYSRHFPGARPTYVSEESRTIADRTSLTVHPDSVLAFLQYQPETKTYAVVAGGIKLIRPHDVLRYGQVRNPGPLELHLQQAEFLALPPETVYTKQELFKDLELALEKVKILQTAIATHDIARLKHLMHEVPIVMEPQEAVFDWVALTAAREFSRFASAAEVYQEFTRFPDVLSFGIPAGHAFMSMEFRALLRDELRLNPAFLQFLVSQVHETSNTVHARWVAFALLEGYLQDHELLKLFSQEEIRGLHREFQTANYPSEPKGKTQ